MPDFTLLLVAATSALVVLLTVVIYDRIVRDLRRQLADADIEAQMWADIAVESRHRHPSSGDQR